MTTTDIVKGQVVENRLEQLMVGLWILITKWFLITKYFGHPFRSIRSMGELERLRKRFMGDFKRIKLTRAGGFYYYDLNTPGFPSQVFNRYYESELNKIYRRRPTTELKVLLFGITKKCALECEHCYEWDELNKQEVMSTEDIEGVIRRFQKRGVYQIQFGGGEPISRLKEIEKIVPRFSHKSDFAMVTSGFNLTVEKIDRLKRAGVRAMTISLDHHNEEQHDSFRGKKGSFRWALDSSRNAVQAGLVTGLSLCVTRNFANWDDLMKYADLAQSTGVGFIQLVEPRAVGHYAGKDVELSVEDKDLLKNFYEELNFSTKYTGYPIITYHGYHQRRVGCVGAGGRYLYVDTNGDLKACPFCGSSYGSALHANLDEVINEMKRQGCGAYGLADV